MKNHVCSFLSRLALPGLMSLILLSPAHSGADTITTFNVSGTALNTSGMTLDSCPFLATCAFSGTFLVDTTNGTFVTRPVDITLPGLPAFNILLIAEPIPSGFVFTACNCLSRDELQLAFTTAPTPGSLKGFTSGSILPGESFESFGNYVIVGGSITPVPEPSTLVLLTGGIGLVLSLTRSGIDFLRGLHS